MSILENNMIEVGTPFPLVSSFLIEEFYYSDAYGHFCLLTWQLLTTTSIPYEKDDLSNKLKKDWTCMAQPPLVS